jgi:hypothetical protein
VVRDERDESMEEKWGRKEIVVGGWWEVTEVHSEMG